MTKPRLTQDEHIELGAKLAGMREELVHCQTQLARAYPRSGPEARAHQLIKSAVDDLDKARSDMENQCFAEHPDTAATTDYYPHSEDRAAVVVPEARRAP
ncbi:hypothetical protein [Kitasatospora camelliae]|uniref:Uncharacterized protein n=1 Tax=Kitasatospora camelliae TaxID=3156397 RepID=A0AAU8K6K0_9ACTN